MKLDYDLLKKILQVMEEEPSHLCSNFELAIKVNVGATGNGGSMKIEDDALFEKFIGHIHILNDHGCIDCESPTLGFRRMSGDNWVFANVKYRMTSNGYAFLDMLKNKTVFNKIKGFSIDTAIEAGKALLIKAVTEGLT